MKKIYLMGLASLLFAACSSEDAPVVDPATTAEGSQYMAINIVANNASSRVEYDNGDDAESKVDLENVAFYFFDASGNAFAVNGNNNYAKPVNIDAIAGETEGGEAVTWTTNTNGENVTKVSSYIVVLQQMKGTVPSQVVAVVNYNFELSSMNLETLREKIVTDPNVASTNISASTDTYKNDNLYLMSNSAYKDATNGVVYATAIGADNIGTTLNEAKGSPVDIYVERVVAKVQVSPDTNHSDGSFGTGVTVTTNGTDGQTELGELYAKVVGWAIYDNTTDATLVKDLANCDSYTWADWATGTYRSFWATTNGNVGKDDTATLTYNKMVASNATKYTYENTLDSLDTSVAIAAVITKADGTPVELYKWLSQYYTEAGLQTAIANYLRNDIWSSADQVTYSTVTPDSIGFAQVQKDYHVKATLTVKDDNKCKYYDAAHNALNQAQVDAVLAKIPKIQAWKNGMCYYYTTIQHTNGANGIVRNHWYQLSIGSITGLGTPVYDPENVVDPQKPTDDNDDEWYLDTKLNILSWKIVGQTVNLTSN